MSNNEGLSEQLSRRLSEAWDQVYQAMPYYNVVKLIEGYDSLLSCIVESAARKQIDNLVMIGKSLDENLEKIAKQTCEDETGELSRRIVHEDLRRLSKIVSDIERKLLKNSSDPPYAVIVSKVEKACAKYSATKDDRVLRPIDCALAEVVLRSDVSLAKKLKTVFRENRRSGKYLRTLNGYETMLSQYLFLVKRMGIV